MIRHFTASAFVVDSQKRILLLWHKKAQKWMPPGGHIDENELPEDAAKRECKEETGLDVEITGDAQDNLFATNPAEGRILKKPFAFLLETIEARPAHNEPAHEHMDFVYLARPVDEDQVLTLEENEGEELRWFTADEVQAIPDEKIYSNVRGFILNLQKESD
ncbi:NUDIX domain-containing protein [Candidatus Peribacteria bacterium]|nr:MAG: NUDIX domain-containing protein [Candidatus Peribacteria bacterium]